MPPKVAKTAAAAAAETQANVASPDQDQVVSFGALKTYMDSVIKQINANTDDKFSKINQEITTNRKQLANVQTIAKANATAIAASERHIKEASKAKKELVLSQYDMKSTDKNEQLEEVYLFIQRFDKDIADYEVRTVDKVGEEGFTRYIITVVSEHVRDRILCKAIDNGTKNIKAGLPKAERKEKSRIHTMKQECHEKNKDSTGAFL